MTADLRLVITEVATRRQPGERPIVGLKVEMVAGPTDLPELRKLVGRVLIVDDDDGGGAA